VLEADTNAGYALAVVGAVNTVIATAYYMKVMRVMWMADVPDGDITPVVTPAPVQAALAITAAGTLALGVLPSLVVRFGDIADLSGALGR
jgi:NADH:ubiquinone oxidoreductase subunit 2 (subunit N)